MSAGCSKTLVGPPSPRLFLPALNAFLTFAQPLAPRIESALDLALRFDDDCPPRLAEAIRYAVLAPGKRLRPAMALFSASACVPEGESTPAIQAAMPAAVAVEMIHAYSLIHDDLPAMDDDDLRRGRPTVHIQFDEATAILAGDALQAEAFGHLCRAIPDAEMAIEAVTLLARASGAGNLVGGQMDDLAAESLPQPGGKAVSGGADGSSDGPSTTMSGRTIEFLEAIHRRKTGALFAASINLGSLLVGAAPDLRRRLDGYADSLGLAFQVVDDLLDATAAAETLGKRSGKDLDRGKLTYVGLLGIDGAREKARQLVSEAKDHLDSFGAPAEPLRALADYVQERSH